MKEKNIKFERKALQVTFSISFVLTTLLSACGGGGSSSSTPAANLSAVQQSYESFALARNGGQHFLRGSVSFSTSSTGVLGVDTAGSFLFTLDSSLTQSPAVAGPQLLTTGTSTLAPAFAVPAQSGQRYLVGGRVVAAAIPAQVRVSYVGSNVEETSLASDGSTVVQTLLGTSYTAVPLSGSIANSPSELFNSSALGVITSTFNGTSLYNRQASWQSGSAYLKVVRQFVGDTVTVGDCAAPSTTGPNVTPCATTASTLEAFFPHTSTENNTYNLSDGQIVTLAGTRAWVANAASNSATPAYQVYFQNNGQIFSGNLTKDGTTLEIVPVGGATPQNFYIFLNGAAVQSVKSALTF